MCKVLEDFKSGFPRKTGQAGGIVLIQKSKIGKPRWNTPLNTPLNTPER